MTDQMLLVFGILAGAVGLFAWGRPRADVVAILVVLALILSGVLRPEEALAGFGNPVVILIAARIRSVGIASCFLTTCSFPWIRRPRAIVPQCEI